MLSKINFVLVLDSLGTKDYIILGLGVVVVVLVVALVLVFNKYRKTDEFRVKIKKGVRYTADLRSDDLVTHYEKDILLDKGVEVECSKKGKLLPGKYAVLSADSSKVFNLRVGGLVKEFKHNDAIVIAEGDKITAVSNNVILR
jgi:hypothetical protein